MNRTLSDQYSASVDTSKSLFLSLRRLAYKCTDQEFKPGVTKVM